MAGGGSQDAAAQGRIESAQTVQFERDGAGFSGSGADRTATAANRLAGKQNLGQDAAEFGLPARFVVAGQFGEVGQCLVERRVVLAEQG